MQDIKNKVPSAGKELADPLCLLQCAISCIGFPAPWCGPSSQQLQEFQEAVLARLAKKGRLSEDAFTQAKSMAMKECGVQMETLWSRIEEVGVAEEIQKIQGRLTDIEDCSRTQELQNILKNVSKDTSK